MESNKFLFSFVIEDRNMASFTSLKLFNGYNEIVKEGYGDMNVQVPKGIYTLRIEINEHVEDRKYRVDKDIDDNWRL
ncbi:hypothetical protein [Chitinophaga pinensis]|uniref:Uncharacterized protein n=1 Tax=Chitinophaga pinensis TaxID=79329 RepID=A0A5C6LKK0_9BACT|nr:hypothetical protein [Chitinophaga pinensis]TWV93273.1 hypothetical protein FEF09_27340 [Chitinophaga pinensis]